MSSTRKRLPPGCAERGIERDPRSCGLLSVALAEDISALAQSLQKYLAGTGPVTALHVGIRSSGGWKTFELPGGDVAGAEARWQIVEREWEKKTVANRLFQLKAAKWRGLALPFSWDGLGQAVVVQWRGPQAPAFTIDDKEYLRRMREVLAKVLKRMIGVTMPPTQVEASEHQIDALPLNANEKECVRLAVEGWTNREIGESTGQSEAAVKFMLYGVYRKLGIRNRAQLAARLGS